MTSTTRRGWSMRAALVALASLALAATAMPAGAAGQFDDDDYNAHEPNIEAVAAAGVTQGCGPDDFCPNQRVTRAQMAAFLVRALDLPGATRDHFVDDSRSSLEDEINALAESGITGGCTSDRYCPNDPVSRAQMATFLVRGFELPSAGRDRFGDDAGNRHEANINALAESGITGGCGGDRYCPNNSVTRGQMATFLTRALELDPTPVGPYLLQGVVRGEIMTTGSRNTHRFTIDDARRVTFQPEDCVSGSDYPEFVVSDEVGREVDVVGGSSPDVMELPAGGTFTLTTRYDYRAGTTYCFSLYDVDAEQRFDIDLDQFVTGSGPNGAAPKAGAGTIGITGERDIYRFTVTEARRVTFQPEDCVGSSDYPEFVVSDEVGREVDVVGGSSPDVMDLPAAGAYTLTTRYDYSAGTAYCFSLTDVTDPNPQ